MKWFGELFGALRRRTVSASGVTRHVFNGRVSTMMIRSLAADVEIRVGDAPETSVTLTGDEKLLELIDCNGSNGILIVQGTQTHLPIDDLMLPKVVIETPATTDVDLSVLVGEAAVGALTGRFTGRIIGAGNVRATALRNPHLAVIGAGNIVVEEASGDEARAVIAGTGEIKIVTGSVTSFHGLLRGSGNIAFGGTADIADVRLQGFGTVHVETVTKEALLRHHIGIGKVTYGNR